MNNITVTPYDDQVQDILWPSFLISSLLAIIIVCVQHSKRPLLPVVPRKSPNLWTAYEWPIIGSALRFYSRRRDMLVEGTHASPDGTFSFHIGKRHVINIDGLEGRKTFFESKEFSVAQGYMALITI